MFRGISAKKVGSACASRFFFDGPSIASVACDPKITARFRGGRVSELSSLAGGPLASAHVLDTAVLSCVRDLQLVALADFVSRTHNI
jgi:hypothetical protein